MRTRTQLIDIGERMRKHIATMKRIRDNAKSEEQLVRLDASRTPKFVADKTQEIRQAAVAEMSKPVAEMRVLRDSAREAVPYWRSTLFVMSRARFDADEDRDALLRSRHAAEFALMPPGLLKMHADFARASNNTPLLWQAWLAGQRHKGEPGWEPIDLAGYEVKEQTEARAILTDCLNAPAEAELVIAATTGRNTGVQQLGLAHAMSMPPLEPTLEFGDRSPQAPEPDTLGVPVADSVSPIDRINAAREATAA